MKTIKVSTQPKADTKRLKVADLKPGPQMDALVAEARGWKLIDGAWCKTVFAGNEDDWPVIDESDYNPSGNGGQAMALVKEFPMVFGCDDETKPTTYRAQCLYGHCIEPTDSPTPEIAICRAVISSAFGEEVSLSDDNVASRFGETVEVEE